MCVLLLLDIRGRRNHSNNATHTQYKQQGHNMLLLQAGHPLSAKSVARFDKCLYRLIHGFEFCANIHKSSRGTERLR